MIVPVLLGACAAIPPPAPARRLDNVEYLQTLADLLFIEPPRVALPADAEGATGFTNDASALAVSPLLVEQYAKATDEALSAVFVPLAEQTTSTTFQAEGPGPGYDGGFSAPDGYAFAAAGALTLALDVEQDGAYRFDVLAQGTPVAGAPVLAVLVNGTLVGTSEVPEAATTLPFSAVLPRGPATVDLVFANPSLSGERVLTLDAITLVGPLDPETGPTAAYARLVGGCDPAVVGARGCAGQLLAAFAPRAWRRPLREGELAWLLGQYDDALAAGLDHLGALRASFALVLLSEDFVFLFEGRDRRGELDAYALASRLSYFLWSTMPDDALFARAADGSLRDPEVLRAEAERMLLDPRATALVERFAGRWLDVPALDEVEPDPTVYPGFDEALRASMIDELNLVLADVVFGETSIDELLGGRTTWVDARLAEHYGLPFDPIAGPWQRVSTASAPRRGVLTAAGWLTAHSHPTRPSTVARGKWVFEDLLCGVVPPPPAGVPLLPPLAADLSVREQEEQQRLAPGTACADCHAPIDPWGHAAGLYDGIGALRSVDELGYPIDARVDLPGGPARSILDAIDQILADPRYPRCAAERLWGYALGRPLTDLDQTAVDTSVASLASHRSLRALVLEIVGSAPFRGLEAR